MYMHLGCVADADAVARVTSHLDGDFPFSSLDWFVALLQLTSAANFPRDQEFGSL